MAILFSSSFQPDILVVSEVSEGRLLHVKTWFEDVVINFVNVYAPCVGPARVRFLNHMQRFVCDAKVAGLDAQLHHGRYQ